MSAQTTDFRDYPPFQYHEHRDFYDYFAGFIILMLGILIGARLFAHDSGYGTNLYTEILSVGATIFILDRRAQRRDAKRREDELRSRLMREARSTVNHIAIQAINELQEYGWLTDGLRGANLTGANLVDANLESINLSGSNLWRADLNNAYMFGTNLAGARLEGANLAGAKLTNVNLHGANLMSANLHSASLLHTRFNEQTTLPDARLIGFDTEGNDIYDKYWIPDTDMTRYTDPNHPDFWQPSWAKQQNTGENPTTNN